jgi:2-methylisocitrate lyase-like PEP mutase family enzyme
MTQLEKASSFKTLHLRPGIFVMPNPWDAGSAKILALMGFEALASTSAGLAFSLGKPDGEGVVSREENLDHLKNIICATDLPVSADLENGYGEDPEICAETILMGANTGLVGGSIEDATGNPTNPIYPFDLSVARVKAAVEVSRSLPFPFMLTARAENYIHGRPDLRDTIKRLESYAVAGADVLYAPGLKTADEIDQVVRALSPKPVNILLDPTNEGLSIDQLQTLGVKRITLGSTLARAAYSAFYHAAQEIRQQNKSTIGSSIFSYDQINDWFRPAGQAK